MHRTALQRVSHFCCFSFYLAEKEQSQVINTFWTLVFYKSSGCLLAEQFLYLQSRSRAVPGSCSQVPALPMLEGETQPTPSPHQWGK